MRKVLLMLMIGAVAAIAFYRQRLFLRDPLGKVLVDGVAVKDARVFINYSNDVLTMYPDRSMVMVQGWDRTPGQPERLACVRALACLTTDDHAPKTALHGGGGGPEATMSDREVRYRRETGETIRIVLR